MIARRVSPEILTPILRYLLFLVVVPFVVVLSTEHVEGRKSAMRPPEILRFESRAGFQLDQARIDRLMRPWLSNRLTDLAAHKAYVDISIEARPERSGPGWGGSDDPLWHYYTDLSDTSVASIRDVALWALAYCELQRDSLRRALTLLDRMQNRQLAGTGVTRGIAHYGLGQYAEGDSVLHAEITSGQDVEAATIALANILLAKRDWDALDKLRTDPHARRFVPGRVLRALDYHSAATIPYFIGLLRSQAEPVMPVLILLALYTTGVWFFLIRWWDAFEKEPWSASLIAVALGAISPIGICAFRDAANQIGGWTTTGDLAHDFLFYVFGVGVVEECVKIAPVFVLGWLGARQMNERSDWMIYGCLSALGFSLNENYGYLVAHGLQVGTPRFFLATPLHLSLTGFLALTLRRIYQRESHAWRRFAAALMGVALIHGTYDFLASSASPIAALAGAVLGPLWGLVFVRIFETVASSSPFRRNPAAYRMSCTSWFMGAFALLCILNYVTIARVLGAEEASSKLAEDLVAGQVLLLIGLVYSRLEFVKVDAALLAHRRRSQPGTGAVGRTATGGPHRS